MCTGNFVAEERKSGRKTQLGLGVVRFHFASLQTVFPSSFTRGRSAISCACATRRGLYPPWSKESWGQLQTWEDSGSSLGSTASSRGHPQTPQRGWRLWEPYTQDWDFRNPSEDFSFPIVCLFVSEGHCRGELWQIPGLRGLYFLHPNCQTPPNTYVLVGAIDWNIWNQNSRKSRTDVFPDQGKPCVAEPLGLPAPCQCCCGWGWLLLT